MRLVCSPLSEVLRSAALLDADTIPQVLLPPAEVVLVVADLQVAEPFSLSAVEHAQIEAVPAVEFPEAVPEVFSVLAYVPERPLAAGKQAVAVLAVRSEQPFEAVAVGQRLESEALLLVFSVGALELVAVAVLRALYGLLLFKPSRSRAVDRT